MTERVEKTYFSVGWTSGWVEEQEDLPPRYYKYDEPLEPCEVVYIITEREPGPSPFHHEGWATRGVALSLERAKEWVEAAFTTYGLWHQFDSWEIQVSPSCSGCVVALEEVRKVY